LRGGPCGRIYAYVRPRSLTLGILWRHYDTIEVSKRETLVLLTLVLALTLTPTLAPSKAYYASNPNPS